MKMSGLRWVWVLIGWTVFLWVSRLRNVVSNDELTTTGTAIRVVIVVVFLMLAGLGAVGVRRQIPQFVQVLVIWTAGYWLVRGTGILLDGDYSLSFKAIHTLLMAVSLGLAALTARQTGMASRFVRA